MSPDQFSSVFVIRSATDKCFVEKAPDSFFRLFDGPGAAQFAFPHHERSPSHLLELHQSRYVSLYISVEFWEPIFCLGTWDSAVDALLMLVPETAVDKNHLPAASENKVGITGQVFLVQPVSKPKAINEFSQTQLWFCVGASDSTHVFRSPGRIDRVNHGKRLQCQKKLE